MALTAAQEAQIDAALAYDAAFISEARSPGSTALTAAQKSQVAALGTGVSVPAPQLANLLTLGGKLVQEIRSPGSSDLTTNQKAQAVAMLGLNPDWFTKVRGGGGGGGEEEPPPPPGPISLVNITTLRTAGWPVPDPNQWWMTNPAPSELKSRLIAPQQSDAGGIVIKRLWMPRLLASGNYDPGQMATCIASTNSMHRRAMRAWYYLDVLGDSATFDSAMLEAKAAFNTQIDAKLANSSYNFPSYIAATAGVAQLQTALVALDWIKWTDAAEFEAAFEKVRALVADSISRGVVTRPFRIGESSAAATGYWSATPPSQTGHQIESMLAMCVYGVNTSGASHTWANGILNGIGLDPLTNSAATYSPWDASNVMNLISLGNGGGREWGAYAGGPSMGGYEENFAWQASWMLRAMDTATASYWQFVERSIYVQSRYIGLMAMEDKTVEKTKYSGNCNAHCEIFARLLADRPAGGHYIWLVNRNSPSAGAANVRELQALAGPRPTALAPSGSFAGRVGSWWWYKEDLAMPDSCFRVGLKYHSLDNHREMGHDRTMRLAIGSVGLVGGHVNRCFPSSMLANGVFWAPKSAAGDPMFADSNYWGMNGNSEFNHSLPGLAAVTPEAVANEPVYLKGTQDVPALASGIYSWTRNWSDISEANTAITQYELDTVAKKLTLTDEFQLTVPASDYLAWNFSCSHTPTIVGNSLTFTDGTDTIRVTLEPLVAITLTPRVWTDTQVVKPFDKPFNLGSYTRELEWHKSGEGAYVHRIASIVGFEVNERPADGIYRMRVTIETNPAT